ncbi:hypothetical protein K469DRAFT_708856 [Zopfia rhizophila CBS 207.26]|uniref:Protein kinase domain-containing protein n=1 Tax=Zopfia rhizophila CBS 207.26 TaxID=1314779 RepID=A0A6A6DY94_9PEZI|nr:hypothetical protein K469DRAFT_708856 [Zopfia rhizophila CBS 207.26]
MRLAFDAYHQTLPDLVHSRRPFDADVALASIEAGIDHLYSLGIIRCDIKPQNVLVNESATSFLIVDVDSCHRKGKILDLKWGAKG